MIYKDLKTIRLVRILVRKKETYKLTEFCFLIYVYYICGMRKTIFDYLDKMPDECDGGTKCLTLGCQNAPFRKFCKVKFSKTMFELLDTIRKSARYIKDLNRVSVVRHCRATDYNFDKKIGKLNEKELKILKEILQLDENIHFHYDKNQDEYLAASQDIAKLFEISKIDDITFE